MLVRAAPKEHFEWLVERTSCAITDGFRAIEAVDAAGAVRGMVGFDSWMPNSCMMHIALDTPIAFRALLRPAFEYVFEETGRGIALGIIPTCNAKSLKLARHAGFSETHRIHNGWSDGVHVMLLEMRREHCRWLRRRQKEAA